MLLHGIICIWLAIEVWRWHTAIKSGNINSFLFIAKEGKQMQGIVQWTPSVSADVVSQHLTVMVNGAAVIDTDYQENTTKEASFPVNPGDNVTASLYASDGTWKSEVVTESAVAPSVPAAPTGFGVSFAA